ncbi:oxygenase MpaB family protein [Streptomyces sp. NRRL S-1314]|uniref:oxygenase MpaB family protein n=1 Tax=Streptomyces sp. NRRL S-1314 TaxID=1463882 RepID=UPI0004C9DA07|nr:oxygenase MpaB family protein [Streptomyces sp. NRRL S-1314]
MGRYGRLARMRQMDPQRDFEQIYRWITQYEFPRDYLHGTSVAFLRDYGVPRISRLLDRTQEFERAGQKRYDDTVLIAYEMVRDGMDSEHGRAAARHLNRIHGRYRILNEDFLYVLATTVVGPKRWIDRFGWRPLCAQETETLALVGRRMGEMMGISGVPRHYAEFERMHDAYEREMFAYDPANRRVAAATLRVMAAWYPAPLRKIAVRASLAVLDEPLLRALGFRPQPVWVRAVVHRTFRLRAACIRLLPARPERFPRGPKPRTYPFGWTLDDLGPHWAQSRPLEPLRDEGPASGTPADPEVADPEPPGTEPSAQKPSDRRRRQGGYRSPAAPAVRAPREETP